MTSSSEVGDYGREPVGEPSSRRRSLPVLLLAGCVFVSCLPALTSGTYFVRDIMLQYIPARTLLADSLADGRVPLWNPLLHGGQPYLANPQNMASYPPWLISCALPLLTGFNLMIALHLVLAAASAYWLSRTLGLGRAASFSVGFIFAFCGVVVSLVNLTHMLFTLSWMPCLIACFVRLSEKPGVRWFSAAGLVGGMTVLAGGVEMILVSFITLGVIFLVRFDRATFARNAALLAGVVALSASIGAVRIWTTWDYLPETARGEGQEYSELVRFSVHPHRLPELVAPGFMGSTNGIALSHYRGRKLEDKIPYLFSIHFGACALLLAVAGLMSAGSRLTKAMRVTLGLLAAVGLVLSLGRYLPGFELATMVPFLSKLRYPIKFMAFVALPIALLSGAGLDALTTMSRSRRRLLAFGAGVCAITFAALSFSAKSAAGRGFWTDWFDGGIRPEEFGGLALSLAIPAVALSLFAVLVVVSRLRPVVVVALACCEVFFASSSVNSVAPRSIFDPPASLEAVRQTTGDGYFQRVRPPAASIRSADDSDVWSARWMMEVYELYTAYLWQVPQVFHSDFDGLAPERVIRLRDIAATEGSVIQKRILELAGVRAVMSNELEYTPGLELAGTFRGPGGETLFLYRNETLGPARFVTRPRFVSSPQEAEAVIMSPDFDGTSEVALEADPYEVGACDDAGAKIEHVSIGPNATRTRVESVCAGYLVLSEAFLPGWTATVDGVEVTPLRADVAFTAIRLDAGTHEVMRAYRPRGLTPALLLSLISGLAAILVVIWASLRGWRTSPTQIVAG